MPENRRQHGQKRGQYVIINQTRPARHGTCLREPGITRRGRLVDVESEHIRAYEIGSKNRFLDRTLQVNLEAWLYKYTNIGQTLQFYGCTPVCGGLPSLTVGNAGEANYHGQGAGSESFYPPRVVGGIIAAQF